MKAVGGQARHRQAIYGIGVVALKVVFALIAGVFLGITIRVCSARCTSFKREHGDEFFECGFYTHYLLLFAAEIEPAL